MYPYHPYTLPGYPLHHGADSEEDEPEPEQQPEPEQHEPEPEQQEPEPVQQSELETERAKTIKLMCETQKYKLILYIYEKIKQDLSSHDTN